MVLKHACDSRWFGNWCHVILVYLHLMLIHFSQFQGIIQNLKKYIGTPNFYISTVANIYYYIFICLSAVS